MRAITVHERLSTHTKPLVVTCEDGNRYAAKAQLRGRPTYSLFREQFIGTLGRRIGAPVPRVTVIDLSLDLLLTVSVCGDVIPGLAHGSAWIPDTCSATCGPVLMGTGDGQMRFIGMEFSMHASDVVRRTENRSRFAHLTLLNAWVGCPDTPYREFLYRGTEPPLVYAVDHEHHGVPWDMGALTLPGVACDDDGRHPSTFNPLDLTAADLRAASEGLQAMTNDHVIDAVRAVPIEWEPPEADRANLVQQLLLRRAHILEKLSESE